MGQIAQNRCYNPKRDLLPQMLIRELKAVFLFFREGFLKLFIENQLLKKSKK